MGRRLTVTLREASYAGTCNACTDICIEVWEIVCHGITIRLCENCMRSLRRQVEEQRPKQRRRKRDGQ